MPSEEPIFADRREDKDPSSVNGPPPSKIVVVKKHETMREHETDEIRSRLSAQARI